ncbi:PEP-CTERM sorting domain-containing protein [Tunturibacter psychrotolerans]|uniref:PEP-CTERM sorting domain-containing protein n=1 Tax=Tunturiibacter psychrotolerans TaxID=3069686 RepID=A0AAU7ZST0_9BACT
MRFPSLSLVVSSLLLAAAPAAFADTVTWADWNAPTKGVVTGTIGTVGVTYSGEISFVNASNVGNFNYFQPIGSYVGGVVGNAATNGGLIAITGAPGNTDTFNFSTAVSGIVLSEVSLGQPTIATQYTFDQGFSIEACGPNIIYGGGCISKSGDTLIGNESDGTILFTGGPVTSLSFTAQNPEFWNGFTIGLVGAPTPPPAVPEPDTLALVGTGLLGLLT